MSWGEWSNGPRLWDAERVWEAGMDTPSEHNPAVTQLALLER